MDKSRILKKSLAPIIALPLLENVRMWSEYIAILYEYIKRMTSKTPRKAKNNIQFAKPIRTNVIFHISAALMPNLKPQKTITISVTA
jgi:hypothetical protein